MTSYASHESSLTTGASPSAKVERAPVLSLKLNNISKTGDKADMAEDLCSMWSVFHQCSKSGALHEGERLANLTWRLWSRETACKHVEEDAVFQDDDSDGVLAVLPGVETQQPPSDPEDDPWEPDSSEDEAVNTRRSTTDTSFSTKAKAPLSMPASPLPARSFQSSTSAPTRPPLHQTISFQKRKKTRSGSFQTAHRSLTPVELQELLSTILPMRVPNACPSSSTNAAVDFTTPIPTTLPLPVATGQHSTSSQPDPSNSSIETQCSDQGFARMALSNSDTSIEVSPF